MLIARTAPKTAPRHLSWLFCLFVFATAADLFVRTGLSSYCWMLCYAGTGLWCYVRWRETWRALAQSWIVFLPPAYYCLSTGWSLAPWDTLTSGLQLMVTTLIAVRLAISVAPRSALQILALVMSVAIAASLLNGAIGFLPPAWEHNDALLGIFTQKNAMGKATTLAAVTLLSVATLRGRPVTGLLLVAALWPVVTMTRSAGAEVTFLSVAAFGPFLALTRLPAPTRAQILGLSAAMALLLGLAYLASGGSPLTDLLTLTGKSRTLTGRTEIWQLGLERWQQDRLWGIGHKSFWIYDTYAVRHIHDSIEDGLYWFHNIYIDILVAGGLAGAAICGLMLATLILAALGWFCRAGDIASIGWGMILMTSLIAGTVDNVMFTPHGLNHLLIVMGYIYARRARRAPAAHPPGLLCSPNTQIRHPRQVPRMLRTL